MDPITIWLIVSMSGVATAVSLAVVSSIKARRLHKSPPESVTSPPVIPKSLNSSSDDAKEDGNGGKHCESDQDSDRFLSRDQVVQQIVGDIVFSVKMTQVGVRVVGERYLGVRTEESLLPGGNLSVRPMRDISEIGSLLSSEHAYDDDMFFARMASGDAMVRQFETQVDVFEDVHEPVMKAMRRCLYVLLDVSPSMFPSKNEWRQHVWKPLTLALITKARLNEVEYFMRYFGGTVSKLRHAISDEEFVQVEKSVQFVGEISGTDIVKALGVAKSDFEGQDYDSAQIVLITDGEHNGTLDPAEQRALLDEQGIKLYAVLLGVENDNLSRAAHQYVRVDQVKPNRFDIIGRV